MAPSSLPPVYPSRISNVLPVRPTTRSSVNPLSKRWSSEFLSEPCVGCPAMRHNVLFSTVAKNDSGQSTSESESCDIVTVFACTTASWRPGPLLMACTLSPHERHSCTTLSVMAVRWFPAPFPFAVIPLYPHDRGTPGVPTVFPRTYPV